MSAYLNSLKREMLSNLPKRTRESKLSEWFDTQPEISRQRPYSMGEIERDTGIAGRLLGELLIRLGWTRHRRWSSKTSYRRYWLPPNYRPTNANKSQI
jgi:hypothetical protein